MKILNKSLAVCYVLFDVVVFLILMLFFNIMKENVTKANVTFFTLRQIKSAIIQLNSNSRNLNVNKSFKVHSNRAAFIPVRKITTQNIFCKIKNKKTYVCTYARRPRLKGCAEDNIFRPKKTTPSKIYNKPPRHYTTPQIYEGNPPEYLAMPVYSAMELLGKGKIHELLCALQNIPDEKRINEILFKNNQTNSEVLSEINELLQIAQRYNDSITMKIVDRLERSFDLNNNKEILLPSITELKSIKKQWEVVQDKKFSFILQTKFKELISLAKKMQRLGISLREFNNCDMWRKYGLLSSLPQTNFVENYLYRHSYTCASKEEAIQILKDLNVLREDGISVDIGKVDQIKREGGIGLKKIVAVEDLIYKLKYSNYNVCLDKITLEKYVDAEYRQYTLLQELKKKYEEWLEKGSIMEDESDTSEKYKLLSAWKSTPKNIRKKILINEAYDAIKKNMESENEEMKENYATK